jgi:hypothetical protein
VKFHPKPAALTRAEILLRHPVKFHFELSAPPLPKPLSRPAVDFTSHARGNRSIDQRSTDPAGSRELMHRQGILVINGSLIL